MKLARSTCLDQSPGTSWPADDERQPAPTFVCLSGTQIFPTYHLIETPLLPSRCPFIHSTKEPFDQQSYRIEIMNQPLLSSYSSLSNERPPRSVSHSSSRREVSAAFSKAGKRASAPLRLLQRQASVRSKRNRKDESTSAAVSVTKTKMKRRSSKVGATKNYKTLDDNTIGAALDNSCRYSDMSSTEMGPSQANASIFSQDADCKQGEHFFAAAIMTVNRHEAEVAASSPILEKRLSSSCRRGFDFSELCQQQPESNSCLQLSPSGVVTQFPVRVACSLDSTSSHRISPIEMTHTF